MEIELKLANKTETPVKTFEIYLKKWTFYNLNIL